MGGAKDYLTSRLRGREGPILASGKVKGRQIPIAAPSPGTYLLAVQRGPGDSWRRKVQIARLKIEARDNRLDKARFTRYALRGFFWADQIPGAVDYFVKKLPCRWYLCTPALPILEMPKQDPL
jgi:hypothetical protein